MSSTIVSGNLADIQGVTWTNAPIEITFVPNPSKPGPVIWTDGPFNPGPILIFSDTNGNFSISLPSTTSIQPSNSTWLFSIGPNASAQAVLLNIPVTGATMNISTLFTLRSNALLIQSLRVPRAYAAFELDEPTNMGQLFYNTTLGVFQFWTGTIWDTIVGTIQPPPANAIISDPTLPQSILQPPGTDFTIGVSGGGQFVVNGTSLLQGDLTVTGQIYGEASIQAYGGIGIDVTTSHTEMGIGLGQSFPTFTLVNAAGAIDERMWLIAANPSQFFITATSDVGQDQFWVLVTRSGRFPTLVELWPPVKLDSTLNVVGDSLFDGQVVGQMAVVAYGSRGTDLSNTHVKIGTGLGNGRPLIAIVDATNATDNKLWLISTNPTQLYFTTTSDAGQDHSWMIVTRNGGLATGIEFKPPVTFDSDVNIIGNLLAANYPFLLTTNGNAGPATLINNAGVITLNVPQYTGSGGGSVTQLVAGANIALVPPGGTGVVTISAAPQIYPAVGIGVSTGSTWGPSIDPTTVPRTNVPNTFTGTPQTFNGQVNVGGSVVAVGGFVAGSVGGNSARMTVASAVSILDAYGPNPSTLGSFLFRTQRSDGSAPLNLLVIDTAGNASFNGSLVANTSLALLANPSRAVITDNAGNLFIDSYGINPTTYGAFEFRLIHSDGSNAIVALNIDGAGNVVIHGFMTTLVVNPPTGSDLFLNYNTGGTGVRFCDGAGVGVGFVDDSGNASFNGNLYCGGFAHIFGSNLGATGGVTTADGLIIGWNLSGGIGETDFINGRGGGGAGGFQWYSQPSGTHIDVNSPPLMNLDHTGNLTTVSATIGCVIIDALTTGNGGFEFNFNKASITLSNFAYNVMSWNLIQGTGEWDFINNSGGGGGGFAWYIAASNSTVTGATITSMFLDSSSNLLVKGQIISGSVGSSNARMAASGNDIFIDAYGIDNATNGRITFRSVRTDGTNLISSLLLDGSGNFIFTGAGSMNGNVFFGTGIQIGNSNVGITIGNSGYTLTDDGGTSFIDGGHTGRLYINFHAQTGGDVQVWGNFLVNNGTKSFAVPHPLLADKDLIHSCIEGPENGVYYRGEVVTKDGLTEVELPDYFEALTYGEDRSVLLTQIYDDDYPALILMAASRIIGGKFRIKTIGKARIAWEVKAVRRIGVDRLAVVRDKFVPKEVANA